MLGGSRMQRVSFDAVKAANEVWRKSGRKDLSVSIEESYEA